MENDKNILRKKSDEFENDIVNIINKLNNLVKNIEIYYNIFDDLVNGYEISKRNFSNFVKFK